LLSAFFITYPGRQEIMKNGSVSAQRKLLIGCSLRNLTKLYINSFERENRRNIKQQLYISSADRKKKPTKFL